MFNNTVFPRLSLSLFAVALIGLSACTAGPMVPHVRTMPLETPEQVGDGRFAMHLEGGGGAGTQHEDNEWTDLGATAAGAVRLRYGLSSMAELTAEGNFHLAIGNRPWGVSAGSLRLGTKFSPNGVFGVSGGLTVGGSENGGFAGPDVGVLLAIPNRYAIPFVSPRFALLFPFDLTSQDTTINVGGTVGVRFPFHHQDETVGSFAIALHGNTAFSFTFGGPDQQSAFGASIGYEHILDS